MKRRSGFTLVEMLISIGVLLIMAAIALSAYVSLQEEDVPEGARSVQSFTEGARDRAIFRKRPVGVRLVLDPNGTKNGATNPVVASTLQYVSSPSDTYKGSLIISSTYGNSPADVGRFIDMTPVDPTDPHPDGWESLRTNRGLIDHQIQMPIKIDHDNNTNSAMLEFIVAWSPINNRWALTKNYTGITDSPVPYELELLPAVMSNQAIRELPRQAVINLPDSKIPSYWYNSTASSYINYLDILFSPRGTGVGSASGSGIIHLHVCSPEDRERVAIQATRYDLPARIATPIPQVMGNPRNKNPERLISINPITGNISVSEVPKFADANEDDIPDAFYDPFANAELGVTAQ